MPRIAIVFAVLCATLELAAPAFAAPANDAFASAEPISGTSASVPGTTVGATLEASEPPHFTSGNGSVWYSWTAPENLVATFATCTSTPGPTQVQAYLGSSVSSLEEVQQRADSSRRCDDGTGTAMRFNAAAGTTYRIALIEFNGFADTTFTLTLSATPSPPNDDFANAQDLGQELNVDVDGTTVGTTLQPGEEDYFGNVGDGDSVWYRWTAPKRMRVWIDNCDAASATGITVYTGTELASLKGVGPHYGEPPTPSCEGNGLYGSRDEFLATAGTTYLIRVYSDLYADGAFHLRMREIRFDGSLSQSASATSVKKGKSVTYTVEFKNLGTIAANPWIELVTSKPNKLGKPVVGTKYLSITTTAGKCDAVEYFAVHPGALCKPGDVAPGDSVEIVAKVRPTESLSHWVGTDYAHGGDSPIYDDKPDNDPFAETKTTVKPKHHHHAH